MKRHLLCPKRGGSRLSETRDEQRTVEEGAGSIQSRATPTPTVVAWSPTRKMVPSGLAGSFDIALCIRHD